MVTANLRPHEWIYSHTCVDLYADSRKIFTVSSFSRVITERQQQQKKRQLSKNTEGKKLFFFTSMPKSSSSFLLLIIFLLLLINPSLSSAESVLDRELLEIRTNPKLGKTNRKPKCCEMRTRSQCSAFPRCRWCRSEALDDLCFSKAEALRLPSQVFLCELWINRFHL